MPYQADTLALLFFRSLAVLGFLLGVLALALLSHLLLSRLFEAVASRAARRRPLRPVAPFPAPPKPWKTPLSPAPRGPVSGGVAAHREAAGGGEAGKLFPR